jgi:hypothetical protein
MHLYSSHEMEKILKIELSTFYKKCCIENIKPIKTKKNLNYYIITQFEKQIVKYYPIKTQEVFYIYESKMNN